jgi:hypothetical protein
LLASISRLSILDRIPLAAALVRGSMANSSSDELQVSGRKRRRLKFKRNQSMS